jgi:glycerophosphoryl diester phosphodiesterase
MHPVNKKLTGKIVLITITVYICFACNKIKYYPDREYLPVKTLILAHAAGGGGTTTLQENSMEAAKLSLPNADGIEVDLQISKDRTVWLAHDVGLPECGGKSYNCFPESHDSEIMQLDSCNGDSFNYSKLEDIFVLMSSSYPGKHISLDVKPWSPCAFSSIDIMGEMNVIADEVIRLTNKYNLQNYVMVESETATFLDYVKKHGSGIDTYLLCLGDFERAMQLCLESGYSGISFKYKFKEMITIDDIQMIRRKGLKIELWTITTEEDIKDALAINPDYIQTDNLKYFEQLK